MGARRHLPLLAAAAPALLLAACGGLTTPDLAVGEISGRLSNVADPAAAHAYVVGHPEVRAPIAADGSYRLARVPVGEQVRVALFDGRERAGVVEVKVESAKRSDRRDDAAELPRASRVVVVARNGSGAKATGVSYAVEGTIVEASGDGSSRAELFPVPRGEWTIRGSMKGFKAGAVALSLPDDVTEALEIEIDEPDDSDERGCLSSSCSDGRTCDGHDGRCYACVADLDCGAGLRCEDHQCVAEGNVSDRDSCEPCSADSQCGDAGQGICLPSGSGTSGFCAHTASSGCDAGFESRSVAGKQVCVPPSWPARPAGEACTKLSAAFGASCLSNASCAGSLSGGVCLKPPGAGATTSGVCTAACLGDSDCPRAIGWGLCVAGLCARGD